MTPQPSRIQPPPFTPHIEQYQQLSDSSSADSGCLRPTPLHSMRLSPCRSRKEGSRYHLFNGAGSDAIERGTSLRERCEAQTQGVYRQGVSPCPIAASLKSGDRGDERP